MRWAHGGKSLELIQRYIYTHRNIHTNLHWMPLPVVVVANLSIIKVGDALLGGLCHCLCRRKLSGEDGEKKQGEEEVWCAWMMMRIYRASAAVLLPPAKRMKGWTRKPSKSHCL